MPYLIRFPHCLNPGGSHHCVTDYGKDFDFMAAFRLLF